MQQQMWRSAVGRVRGSVRARTRDKPPVRVTEALPNRPQTILSLWYLEAMGKTEGQNGSMTCAGLGFLVRPRDAATIVAGRCGVALRAVTRDTPPARVLEALPNRPAGLPSRTKGFFFRACGAKKIRENVLKVTIFLSKNRI